MKNLILVKLGGSVITYKERPFTARRENIVRLAREILKFRNKNTDLIIAHGGGSFPHVPASKYQTQNGIINKNSVLGFSLTADAAIQINRIVVTEFLNLKAPVASFAPLSFIYGKRVFFDPIKKALEIGLIPIIYGDVIMNEKQGFEIYSGEKTLDLLAGKFAPDYAKVKIIYYTDVNGVYDENGKTVSSITPKNFATIKKNLTGSKKTDVTGGMLHKVTESLKLVQNIDAVVYITNGLSRGKSTKISKD